MRTVALRALAAASVVGSAVAAEDVLYSQRHSKRGYDAAGHYNMSFFHINDVHAHLDVFSSSGTDCTNPSRGCYGGYAHIKYVIDTLRPQYNDSLWLNAGDEFQGTMFYTYYKGEKIAETINQLGFDAMTLGNHEFDRGDDELGDFLKNLTFPVISANIVSDNEKLNSTIKPYHIYEKQQIAVIGCTTETVPNISSPGKGTKFLDVVTTVQNTIDHIKATTNITRIVALTHIGYDQDKELAQKTTGLSLIMGGHSHTLLGNMPGAAGSYPTIETNRDGDEVFVVTAYRWGEYLGYIDVTFDEAGKPLAYHGAPIHIDNTTGYDAALQAEIDEWRKPFEAFASEVVGYSNVELDQSLCQKQECVMGDLITDAMLAYRVGLLSGDVDSNVYFALINAGGIRATIDQGNITRGEVLTTFPFGNAVVDLSFDGATLKKVFQGAVAKYSIIENVAMSSFFQVSSGVKISYNPALEVGSQVISMTINGKEIDDATTYHMATLDFIAGGGDRIVPAASEFATLDTLDEVLIRYLAANSPVDVVISGRISKTDATSSSPNSTTTSSSPNSTTTANSTANSTAIGTGVSSTVSTFAVSTGIYANSTVITAIATGTGSAATTSLAVLPTTTVAGDDDEDCEELPPIHTVTASGAPSTGFTSLVTVTTASAATIKTTSTRTSVALPTTTTSDDDNDDDDCGEETFVRTLTAIATGATTSATGGASTASTTKAVSSTVSVSATTPVAAGYTTATIYSTKVYTIISCAATVTNCPAHSIAVTTEIIAVSTTVCPVTEAETTTIAASSSASMTAVVGSSKAVSVGSSVVTFAASTKTTTPVIEPTFSEGSSTKTVTTKVPVSVASISTIVPFSTLPYTLSPKPYAPSVGTVGGTVTASHDTVTVASVPVTWSSSAGSSSKTITSSTTTVAASSTETVVTAGVGKAGVCILAVLAGFLAL